MFTPFVDTNCPVAYGDYRPAADTTRGITLDSTLLGNMYWQMGEGTGTYQIQRPRLIMLVKNSASATLSRNLVVAHATTTLVGSYTIAGLAGALSLVAAGVVEDGYINGVPDGCIFRMVIKGWHYLQMKTASDALTTTVVGQMLTCGANGEVIGQDTSVAAGAATFAQINSVVGVSQTITTNVTDSGAQKLHYVNMPKWV